MLTPDTLFMRVCRPLTTTSCPSLRLLALVADCAWTVRTCPMNVDSVPFIGELVLPIPVCAENVCVALVSWL